MTTRLPTKKMKMKKNRYFLPLNVRFFSLSNYSRFDFSGLKEQASNGKRVCSDIKSSQSFREWAFRSV